MKLQISSDQSISITNVEVINLELQLVLFSDDLPTVIAEDFVDAVRAQIESLLGGEVVQVQPRTFIVKRAVVRVDGEPAIPHNYWIRGILGELAIYKRLYKNAGYQHFPTAAGFDLKSAAEYVQIKTLKNPDGALGAMRKAVDDLTNNSPTPPSGLKRHILKKTGSSSSQLP